MCLCTLPCFFPPNSQTITGGPHPEHPERVQRGGRDAPGGTVRARHQRPGAQGQEPSLPGDGRRNGCHQYGDHVHRHAPHRPRPDSVRAVQQPPGAEDRSEPHGHGKFLDDYRFLGFIEVLMAGMRLQKLFKALIKPKMFLECLTELDDLREVRQGLFDVQLTS